MESSSWPTLQELLYIVFHLTVCFVSVFRIQESLVECFLIIIIDIKTYMQLCTYERY